MVTKPFNHFLQQEKYYSQYDCKQLILYVYKQLLMTDAHKPNTTRSFNQRTNGPVNAHLISWPTKAQNIQNLENIWYRNANDLQNSHSFIYSISCLHLPTFRSLAAIVSKKSTVFTFPKEKPKKPNLTLP